MILLLLGQLCLRLLILLKSLLALIACQLTMRGALGHALGLSAATTAFRCDSVALDHPNVVRIARGTGLATYISRLYLPVNRVLVLAAGVGADADLRAGVLVVGCQLVGLAACLVASNHVRVGTTVGIVLLAIVRGELVLVLEEGVLGSL